MRPLLSFVIKFYRNLPSVWSCAYESCAYIPPQGCAAGKYAGRLHKAQKMQINRDFTLSRNQVPK